VASLAAFREGDYDKAGLTAAGVSCAPQQWHSLPRMAAAVVQRFHVAPRDVRSAAGRSDCDPCVDSTSSALPPELRPGDA
jgi:hypothetical protein